MSDATDRLERSRAALAEAMRRGGFGPRPGKSARPERSERTARPAGHAPQAPGATGGEGGREPRDDRPPPWQRWMDIARRRWQSHPLHLVGEIAVPALGAWAARRPLAFLAVAAAAGACLVAARPWRALSGTGLLVLALRGMGVPSFVLSGLRMRRGARRMAARAAP